MHTMREEPKKSFLEELQSLDEPTKRIVMIVLTVVIMVVVIYVWLAYFNNLLASVGQPQVADNGASTGTAGGNLVDAVRNGTAFIYGSFVNAVHALSNVFQTPRQYIIRPSQ